MSLVISEGSHASRNVAKPGLILAATSLYPAPALNFTSPMIKDYEKLTDYLVAKAKKQLDEAGTNKVEVDVSGGIDSAVVLALAAKTVGPENVIGVSIAINSSDEALNRARLVCKKFNVKLLELDVSDEFASLKEKLQSEFKTRDIDFQATDLRDGAFRCILRATIGRAVNRYFGDGLRWGTGNADEDEYLRFYQKGGDGEVDNNWIAGLYKGDVYRLAKHLGVPEEIINATPTPDLWGKGDDHNDEDELYDLTGVRLTYSMPHKREEMGTIEWVSRERRKMQKENHDIFQLAAEELTQLGYNEKQIKLIETVARMDRITRHKGEMPPGTTVEELMNAGLTE